MKYLSVLLIFVLLTSMLFGCQSERSHIVEEDGKYFLVLDNTTPVSQNSGGIWPGTSVEFDTLDEMISDIKNANFTDEEMSQIRYFFKDENGRILLFDLSKLYEPYHPEAIPDYDVVWQGNYYTWKLTTDATNFSVRDNHTQKGNTDTFNSRLPKEKVILDTEETEDRNATIYYCKANPNSTDTLRYIYKVYTVTSGDSVVHVNEQYDILESEDIPCKIIVAVDRDDQHFHIEIQDLTERPSIEWYTQFELREYTPE